MRGKTPLYLAILWHMHQPLYKDLSNDWYILPWVRLHAIKDYYDMAAMLNEYPSIRQTFNFVPALLLQLEEYSQGKANDKFLELTKKPAAQMTPDEKIFLLKNFFLANWDRMIKPYPRYWELFEKRGRFINQTDLAKVWSRFSSQEYLDLQVWFNLAWCGNTLLSNPAIKKLIQKERNFSEQDKQVLLSEQQRLIREIVPLYRSLLARGQIEASVTPFYHPILPLLYSTRLAKVSDPHTPLPSVDFSFPQDVLAQIRLGIDYFQKTFGMAPQGMWPSEGSVAEEIIPFVADAGIRWIATDEEILRRSLGPSLKAEDLYRPYKVRKEAKEVTIFFRDHLLSDRIGFVYSKWNGAEAAWDLFDRLRRIHHILPQDNKRYLISIIMDGENAWEHYPHNARDFFNAFYKLLSDSPEIRTTTFNDFLASEPHVATLRSLHPGSWINGNFRTWIGHAEKNKAWEYLFDARRFLEENKERATEKTWASLFTAEGSDWFWWYGDDHFSENSEDFDFLFRQHVKNVYRSMGGNAPEYLDHPIKEPSAAVTLEKDPSGLVSPILDGKVTDYYEWLFAGCYKTVGGNGAMHQTSRVVDSIYFGYDSAHLYLRLDVTRDGRLDGLTFSFSFLAPRTLTVTLKPSGPSGYRMVLTRGDSSQGARDLVSFAVDKIIEMAIPLDEIGARDGEVIEMRLIVLQEDNSIEDWPKRGAMKIRFSPRNLEEANWTV